MAAQSAFFNTPTRAVAKDNFRLEFQTPQFVARYMASLIPAHCITVLEPTPGIGNLVKEIPYRCLVTTYDDFFERDKSQRFDCVIMNPPFSDKWAFNVPADLGKTGMRLGYHMMMECMQMSDHVIALMPWFTISDSDVRLRSIYRYGLKSVTALPRKTFQFARIQTVVLEMHKGFTGTTEFKVFSCFNDKHQLSL